MSRPPHIFAGPYIQRSSERRKDVAWVAEALERPSSRFVVLWQDHNLIHTTHEPQAALVDRTCLPDEALSESIFLGQRDDIAFFAIDLADRSLCSLPPDSDFKELRVWGGLLANPEAGLLAYARALIYWRTRHRHCGQCGAPTVAADAGHVMRCTRAGCVTQAFPRIDPAIIVLVTHQERALLGRQASWPSGRYSTIAGFVEPGESLEDAVRREVKEETGVDTTQVRYHSSQPWPFPSSLMIGFEAQATSDVVACPDGELEDARWFSYADIQAGTPLLPPPASISFQLIADWYVRGTGRTLIDEPIVVNQQNRPA